MINHMAISTIFLLCQAHLIMRTISAASESAYIKASRHLAQSEPNTLYAWLCPALLCSAQVTSNAKAISTMYIAVTHPSHV